LLGTRRLSHVRIMGRRGHHNKSAVASDPFEGEIGPLFRISRANPATHFVGLLGNSGLGADRSRDGLADFAPAGKVPCVWEIDALRRFHRLHRAIASFKKDAFAIRLIEQRKAVAFRSQAGEMLNEIVLRYSEKRR